MKAPRQFELIIEPESGDDYGVRIVVSEEHESRSAAHAPAPRVGAIRTDLVAAAVTSGKPRTAVSATRTKPIDLSEEAGVRLTLLVLATAPVRKSKRIDAIRTGIDAMTSEEAFYWYAHVTGPNSTRALKALRTLLAEE